MTGDPAPDPAPDSYAARLADVTKALARLKALHRLTSTRTGSPAEQRLNEARAVAREVIFATGQADPLSTLAHWAAKTPPADPARAREHILDAVLAAAHALKAIDTTDTTQAARQVAVGAYDLVLAGIALATPEADPADPAPEPDQTGPDCGDGGDTWGDTP